MRDWCKNISEKTNMKWRYKRVDQVDFDGKQVSTLEDLVAQ